MSEKAIRTFEEIGRIPGRILKYLLSDHHVESIDENTPYEERLRLMKREELLICIRAGFYGVMCGIGIVWITFLARPFEPDNFTNDFKETAIYFTITIGCGVLLTMIELIFIYIDTIRTARSIALIAGLRPAIVSDDEVTDELIASLMYAGLKAPNSHVSMYGIDPREHINKIVLIFSMVAHKSKVAISRIIIKALYRRIFVRLAGRTASRSVIETASIPVFAIWNFIAVKQVMREIRIRTTVPLLMDELINELYPNGFEALSEKQQNACLVAMKSQVTGVADFHPNIKLFFDRVIGERIDEKKNVFENEVKSLEEIVMSMTENDRAIVLRTFVVVCAMDGRIKRRIRAESKRISVVCPEYNHQSLVAWKRYFLHGGNKPESFVI